MPLVVVVEDSILICKIFLKIFSLLIGLIDFTKILRIESKLMFNLEKIWDF